ncbi:MAG: hypothetical protein ACI9UN_001783 [Granulosicoccus sp.]|jgi:hypothetical protein
MGKLLNKNDKKLQGALVRAIAMISISIIMCL